MPEQNLRRGAAFAVASGATFAVMGALIKQASLDLPNEVIVFLRNGFGLLFLTPWLLRLKWRGLRTHRLGWHLSRTVIGLSAMYCFFYAIAQLRLSEAMLLNYSMPLFIPFIAWAWLGERPPSWVWPAVVMGFIGVLLILKPGSALFSPAGLVGLCSGILAATAMTNIRYISDTEPATRIVFYFALCATGISAVPMGWAWQMPTATAWLLMMCAGLFATLGQLTLTHAYSLAPAARIGSLIYSTVVFAGLIDWWIWEDVPDAYSVAGALLVAGASVLATRREKPRRAPEQSPRPA